MKVAARRKRALVLEPFKPGDVYGTLWFGRRIVAVIIPGDLIRIAKACHLGKPAIAALRAELREYFAENSEVKS
jgi:hypothetical protein